MGAQLFIGLSAVILAVDSDQPKVLATRRSGKTAALPFGQFDPDGDRTLERALRDWVTAQTGFPLGHVEQLYTFGDQNREIPTDTVKGAPADARMISVGYLALTPEAATVDAAFAAKWHNWYAHFPWEDHRSGRPAILENAITPQLMTWAVGNADRLDRARLAFGLDGHAWIEERALERYELLYEAGLVAEATRDAGLPEPTQRLGELMASDHRRILATAISRLRGKLKYRPVIFDMMGERFTLSALQRTVEAILGLRLHTQNFRRSLDRSGHVEGTGEMETDTGGRPAELYRFKSELLKRQILMGVATPAQRRD